MATTKAVSNRSKPTHPRRTKQAAQDEFETVARRLGCDEDKERFEKKLGKIAKAKPEAKPNR